MAENAWASIAPPPSLCPAQNIERQIMGTWGPNSFENDTAADFVEELEGSSDLQGLLDSIEYEQDFEAPLAEQIIAAADCVAIMLDRPGPETQRATAKKIAKFGKPAPELVDAAKNGVSRVLMGGELLDLWAEAGASDFNAAITGLMERLNPEITYEPHELVDPAQLTLPCMFCDKPVNPENLLELAVHINSKAVSSTTQIRPCHLVCLNKALHPKHLIQYWEYTDEDIESLLARMDS